MIFKIFYSIKFFYLCLLSLFWVKVLKKLKLKNCLLISFFYFLKEGRPTPVASKPPSTAKI